MTALDFVLSFIITWTVILVPPVLLRWWRKRPYSKGAAFAWVAGLYFMNHVLFGAMTGRVSTRSFLIVGGFATWHVLRWVRKPSRTTRQELGYDDPPPTERERKNAEMYAKDRAEYLKMLEEDRKP